MIDIDIDYKELQDHLIHSLLIPGLVLLSCLFFGKKLWTYAMSHYVVGQANEWVIIIGSDGKIVKKGIGLSMLRTPWQQVARFPSRINKVEFATQQVTKEMQGIKITGMLVWSVYRKGDGPLKAFNSLGSDLSKKVPKTANDNLTSQAAAIVRSVIATSEISDLLTNREKVRTAIKNEMTEQVKGWGVWLETVEITGVQIMSQALFKDLQASFREDKRQEAKHFEMKMGSELGVEVTKKDLEMKVVRDKFTADLDIYNQVSNIRLNKNLIEDENKISTVDGKIRDNVKETTSKTRTCETETNIEVKKDNHVITFKTIDNKIKRETLNKNLWYAENERTIQDKLHSLFQDSLEKNFQVDWDLSQFNLQAKNLANPLIVHYRALNNVKDCFKDKKWYNRENQVKEKDAMSQMARTWYNQKRISSN